jgi:hypothetical protein
MSFLFKILKINDFSNGLHLYINMHREASETCAMHNVKQKLFIFNCPAKSLKSMTTLELKNLIIVWEIDYLAIKGSGKGGKIVKSDLINTIRDNFLKYELDKKLRRTCLILSNKQNYWVESGQYTYNYCDQITKLNFNTQRKKIKSFTFKKHKYLKNLIYFIEEDEWFERQITGKLIKANFGEYQDYNFYRKLILYLEIRHSILMIYYIMKNINADIFNYTSNILLNYYKNLLCDFYFFVVIVKN